jgi:hypothetical protein
MNILLGVIILAAFIFALGLFAVATFIGEVLADGTFDEKPTTIRNNNRAHCTDKISSE